MLHRLHHPQQQPSRAFEQFDEKGYSQGFHVVLQQQGITGGTARDPVRGADDRDPRRNAPAGTPGGGLSRERGAAGGEAVQGGPRAARRRIGVALFRR
jgi:hypothetical protein